MKTSIKMIHVYQFCSQNISFHKHFGTISTEEIRIAKLCTEVFMMLRHLMTKLYIPKSFLYMSPLLGIVLSQKYCTFTVKCQNSRLFAPSLTKRGFRVWQRRDRESNPGPLAPQAKTLSTTPPMLLCLYAVIAESQ